MWLFIHRPFEAWPVLGTYRIELIYMVVTGLVWLGSGRLRWRSFPLHVALVAFAGVVVLSWLSSPWSGTVTAETNVGDYLKVLVFYVMLVTSVRTERELRLLVIGFLGATGLYMLHSYREFLNGRHTYRMGIVRMIGVDTALGDPNSFSASLVYALPLVLPAWHLLKQKFARALLLGYVALTGMCILQTGSRGAFLALGLFMLLMALRSRHRVALLIATAVLSVAVWLALPPYLRERFTTIVDPSVGPANAQESAESRTEGLYIGLRLMQRFPLLGCGPGAWIPASGSIVESHNLYGQVLGELGTAGVVTFLGVLGALWLMICEINRWYRARPDLPRDFLGHLATAIAIALVQLLFLGFGAHNLYRFNWVWYGGFLVVACSCLRERALREELAPYVEGDAWHHEDYEGGDSWISAAY
jgi:hypothetical protein